MKPEEITALRERIKRLEEDAETYAYKDQANFDLRSRIVTLESDNAALTNERVAVFNEGLQSIRQLAAAQATIEKYRKAIDALYNRNEATRYAVIQCFGVAHPQSDTTALQERLRQAKVDVLREAATCVLAPCARSLIRMADEIEKVKQ